MIFKRLKHKKQENDNFVYHRGGSEPLHSLTSLHGKEIIYIAYNPVFKVAVSADKQGMIEYWGGMLMFLAFRTVISFFIYI